MLVSLAHRRREPEWMDAVDADPKQLESSLRYIRRINRLLGYTHATLWHLERFSRSWNPGQTITMIDVGTGSADIPRAILQWGRQRGFDVRIVGIDLHAQMIHAAARSAAACPRLKVLRADALRLPFESGSFDYALTAMFLHHLSDTEAAGALKEMSRVARRGIIAADLLRNRRAYAWIKLLTLLANPMVRHDAQVSVRQAFSWDEVDRLRDAAGLGYARCYQHFAHRFVLAGQRE